MIRFFAGAQNDSSGKFPVYRNEQATAALMGYRASLRYFPVLERDSVTMAFRMLLHEGVPRQRALAAPGHAGQYHQLALGNLHVDVLQVVLLRIDDFYVVHGHIILILVQHCLRNGFPASG